MPFVVWTVSSPWPGKPDDRCCPYSLYTFTALFREALGSGLARRIARAFPEFEQIHHDVSDHGAQFLGILCSILLSYADHHSHSRGHTQARQAPGFQIFLFPIIGCNNDKSN
ncbi:hypothetical protein AA105894_2874 [Asaia spathodeae NBRC 105894]|nr:hypothetical protein AA105894_2874 [Asaia spathodeae NBRC 105894]